MDRIVSEVEIVLDDVDDLLLHVQYPTRPHVTAVRPEHARYRLEVNQLELTVGTNERSTCFSRSQADHLVGKCSTESTKRQVTRQTYSGTASNGIAARQRCAIGRMVDGRLHLAPVTATLQMRPSLAHLDKVTGKSSDATPRKDRDGFVVSDDDEDQPEKPPAPQTQAIRVKFAREIENSGIKRRETLLEKRRRLDDSDPWVTLDVKAGDRGVPTAPVGDDVDAFSTVPLQQVLRSVCPMPNDAVYITTATNDWSSLRSLPLPDQVRIVMSRVHTIKFAQLRTLLPPTASNDQLLDALQTCATLIHGCWTCRSSLIFPEGGSMSVEHSRAFRRARDFVLHEFLTGSSVTRKAIMERCHVVCDDTLHEAIRMVGKYKGRAYVFKLTPDDAFMQEYPSLVDWSAGWWTERWDELSAWNTAYDGHLLKAEPKPSPARRRRNSSRSTHEPVVKKEPKESNGVSTEEASALTTFVYGIMGECPVRTVVHGAEAASSTTEWATSVTDDDVVRAFDAVHAVHVATNDKRRRGGNATYALTTGRTHPATRRAFTHFVKNKSSFRLKTFIASYPAGDEHPADESDIKLLVEEFCTHKAGIYSLRGDCTQSS